MKIFKLYVSHHENFADDIARECYKLTHEFVTTRLYGEYQKGTSQARAHLLDLDRDMKSFVKNYTRPSLFKRVLRWWDNRRS